ASRPAAPAASPARPATAGAGATWDEIVAALELNGMVREMAHHCALASWDGERMALQLDPARAQLRTPRVEQALAKALEAWAGRPLRLSVATEAPPAETPAARSARDATERQQEAERAIAADPHVEALRQAFDAEIEPGSVRPR
ncbi:MAG TPA: DNA polymerase III subunit gamma/tau C-terminal domain-containing protein, partial [Gammaproteobacteria bacterium]